MASPEANSSILSWDDGLSHHTVQPLPFHVLLPLSNHGSHISFRTCSSLSPKETSLSPQHLFQGPSLIIVISKLGSSLQFLAFPQLLHQLLPGFCPTQTLKHIGPDVLLVPNPEG